MEYHVLIYLMKNCEDCVKDSFGIKPCKAHKELAEDFVLEFSGENILNNSQLTAN